MSISKHSNPTRPRKTPGKLGKDKRDFEISARAPYNFVPLPDRVVKLLDEDNLKSQSVEQLRLALDANLPDHDTTVGLSGWIDCELETLSPLYVRGLMHQTTFAETGDKPFYDDAVTDEHRRERSRFFTITDEPIIPGSSLRGMVRGLFEIMTFSKMSQVTNEPLVYRAVADGEDTALGREYKSQMARDRLHAGYIVRCHSDSGWGIQPACHFVHGDKEYAFAVTKQNYPQSAEKWDNLRQAHVVLAANPRVDAYGDLKFEEVAPGQQYVFVETGRAPSKKGVVKNNYLFGLPDDRAPVLEISREIAQRYVEQVTQEQKKQLGGNRNGVLHERERVPVFYLADDEGNLIFFGHARNFRLPYRQSPRDLVPPSLRRGGDLDLTEAVFGFVKQSDLPESLKKHLTNVPKLGAYASRVTVGDARVIQGQSDYWLPFDGKWLEPHVLSSPKPTTFQHYLVQDAMKGHEPDCPSDLAHFGTSNDETAIRGHKLYWHKGDQTAAVLRATPAELKSQSQLTGIQPVRSKVKFQFRVRFENLRDYELGALLYSLDLPEDCCHSLGMGKPLGMGAVRISAKLCRKEPETRYTTLFAQDGGWHDAAIQEDTFQFKTAFEQFMAQQLKLSNRTFSQHERIRMLFELLKWQDSSGAWLEQTRYMRIDHEQEGYTINEYSRRPVLPDPLHLHPIDDSARKSQPCQPKPEKTHKTTISRDQRTPPPKPVPAILPEVRDTPSKEAESLVAALARRDVSEGEELEIIISAVASSEYECRLGEKMQMIGKLPRDERKDLKVGDSVKVRVKRITPNRKTAILTVKGMKG